MCRRDFTDPPTYNVDTDKHRSFIMGNNKRNMNQIRLSRRCYCLKLHYEYFRHDINTIRTQIKWNFLVFCNSPKQLYMGILLKSCPCLENKRAKTHPSSPPKNRPKVSSPLTDVIIKQRNFDETTCNRKPKRLFCILISELQRKNTRKCTKFW